MEFFRGDFFFSYFQGGDLEFFLFFFVGGIFESPGLFFNVIFLTLTLFPAFGTNPFKGRIPTFGNVPP